MLRTSIAAIVIALAAPAMAETKSQLERQIENKLIGTGIKTDVTKLTRSQATQLYFELTSPQETKFGGFNIGSRQKILAILRQNPATDPALQ